MTEALEQIQAAQPRRFRPYPEYRDSGIAWLGEIPAHWDTPKMWQISRAASGGTPSKDERAYWNGEIPWVSPKDMKRRFIDSSEDRVTKRAVAETGIKLIEPPVMLLVVRGMILAHSLPVAITTVPVTINQDMKAVSFTSGLDPLFMVWFFEGVGTAVRAAIVEEAAHGTKAIRMDEWRSLKVTLPDADEQRAIIAFLDRETAKVDELIAKKERLIELLQEKRTALINRAVTRGLDSNLPTKDSGVEWLGAIPAHWEVMPLKHVAEFINGIAFKPEEWGDEGIPIIRIENLNGGQNFNHTTRKVPARFHATEGDLLFGWSGNRGTSFGPFLWWRAGLHYVNQHIFRIVNYEQYKKWLYWTLRALTFYVEKQAHGIIGMVHITRGELGKIPVPLMPETEQRAIAGYIDQESAKIDSTISRVRYAIDRLREFRSALISAAVTGKIDVREEVQ